MKFFWEGTETMIAESDEHGVKWVNKPAAQVKADYGVRIVNEQGLSCMLSDIIALEKQAKKESVRSDTDSGSGSTAQPRKSVLARRRH